MGNTGVAGLDASKSVYIVWFEHGNDPWRTVLHKLQGEPLICKWWGRFKAFLWFSCHLNKWFYLFITEYGPDSASCQPDYQRGNCYCSYREYRVLSRNASLSVAWQQTTSAKVSSQIFVRFYTHASEVSGLIQSWNEAVASFPFPTADLINW